MGYRCGFCRSCWKLSARLAEPMLPGFRMDSLLAKAGPIRNGGHVSVITYLRRESYCTDVIDTREE